VIGGGDWAKDRIVADAARCLAARKSIFVRNPKAVRPWQHVAEPLAGYLMLGSKLLKKQKDFEGSWNFGPSPKNPKSV
jgi:CDP-glucose 4,6-dehydratase